MLINVKGRLSHVIVIQTKFPDLENASEPTELSAHSRAVFKAAMILSQRYNIKIDGQYIEWQVAQTGGNAIGALKSSCQVVSTSNIIGIIGPAYSRTVPSGDIAASAVVQLFLRFNWTSCVIIYQNDELGSSGVESISQVFSKSNLVVSETIVFDIATQSIRDDLNDILSRSSSRIIIVCVDEFYIYIFTFTSCIEC